MPAPSRLAALLVLGTACRPAAPPRPPSPAPAPAAAPAVPECERPFAAIPYIFTTRGYRSAELELVDMAMSLGPEGGAALDALVPVLAAHPDWRIALAVRTDGAAWDEAPNAVARERTLAHARRLRTFLAGSGVLADRIDLADPTPDRAAGTSAARRVDVRRTCSPAPAPDRDRDGHLDDVDACPDLPEDHDQFEDEDGCPDRDNDRDFIPDAHEWTGTRWTNCDLTIQNDVTVDCRNRPEDHDGFQDEDGCPDTVRYNCNSDLVDPLLYDPKTLRFAAADLDRLAQAVEQIHAIPAMRVWIFGHTGEQRDSKRARRLSQRVADAIRDELVRRGAPAEQLDAIALGDGRPRDTDRTPEGRRNNFRVEVTGDGFCDGKLVFPSRLPTTCL